MNRVHRVLLPLLLGLVLSGGCRSLRPDDGLTQVATIDGLLAGCYDGVLTCGELLQRGDLGLGTFHQLDGEMAVLDGVVYRVAADGSVSGVAHDVTTPFAAVVRFDPERGGRLLRTAHLAALERQLDALCPDEHGLYAVRVDGEFAYVRTRSVPRQQKPYRPLVEVTKEQSVFEREQVRGTLLGFRCPAYVKGINVPGWHLHFLSQERDFGGHVLDVRLTRGLALVDQAHALTVLLPPGLDWGHVNLSEDRSGELHRVER